jgi:hypothetical protein
VKPCLNCTKRGQPESCDYVKQDPHARARQGTTDVQARVQHLEDMVRNLLNGQAILDQDVRTAEQLPSVTRPGGPMSDDGFTPSAAPSPASQTGPSFPDAAMGKFTRAKDQANFVGNEHWEAILEDIAELKIDLETPDTSQILDFKPQILFGTKAASKLDIMSSIPSRPICDMVTTLFFPHILSFHSPSKQMLSRCSLFHGGSEHWKWHPVS